jgi:hypothetical protein
MMHGQETIKLWKEMVLWNTRYWYDVSCYVISKCFTPYGGQRFMTVLARTHHYHCVKPSEHITANFTVFKIHLNIIPASASRSTNCFLSLWFLYEHPVYIYVLSDSCHVTPLCRRPRFDNPLNKRLGIEVLKLLIVQFSPFSCWLLPHRRECSENTYGMFPPIHSSFSPYETVPHRHKQYSEL